MPTSLPLPITSFVGRHEELARITALLADPNCRLLTLLGPGGIGKTSLAIHAAAKEVQFADGVFFVDLAPVSSPDLLPSAIAGALQFTFSGAGDLRLQVADYLGRKQVLLVMDNFEHLLAGYELLTYILQATPHVKFLVTSRERLNIREEWGLPLGGLSFPHDDTNTPLDSYSAVQLFAQRARQQHADFSLSAHAESVQRICRHVEGMPLGLELAATWLRVNVRRAGRRGVGNGPHTADHLAPQRAPTPSQLGRGLCPVLGSALTWRTVSPDAAGDLSRRL